MAPLISVITINYNNCQGLENTIKSVIEQTYSNVEYIVVDGNSTDGSGNVLKQYSSKIKRWVSEPDKGIYDAMNKGLGFSTGDYVIFINSGDSFVDSKVIESIFSENDLSGFDIIYGNSICVNTNGLIKICRAVEPIYMLRYHPIYRHGASFVSRTLHNKFMFDLCATKLGYALDYHAIYRMFRAGARFKYVNVEILRYEQEGISNNVLKNIKFNYLISISDGWTLRSYCFYVKSLFNYYKNEMLKKLGV